MHPVKQHVYEEMTQDEILRAHKISLRWRIYHGEHPKPLRVRPGMPDDNIILNFARIVVDKGVSFLFGKEIHFELVEGKTTEAEAWLDAVWRANHKMTLLQKLALNGAIAGHAFLKIVPTRPYPRLIVLDPADVSVVWEPDDIEAVLAYKIQYRALDPQTGQPTAFRQLIERDGSKWRIIDQRSEVGQRPWQTTSEAEWPYPWPPIVDCQNLPCPNEYWGISDLEDDIIALNNAINFVLSNIARIIRYYAHPRIWGRGFTADRLLKTAPDEILVFPSPEAELRVLDMSADLSSSTTFYRYLREALHEISRIPEVATGKLENVGSLSGTALQILYQPLIEKTEMKRRTYGDMLVELNRRLLAMGGFGDDNITTIHWPALLPEDPESEAKVLLMWQQLGVSQDTILRRLNLDPDLERQKQAVTSADLGEQLLSAFERGE